MNDQKRKNGFEPYLPLDRNIPSPDLADGINLPVVFAEIQNIKNNPSMIKTYFAAMRAKYKLSKEIAIINNLEEYCQALTSGVASKVELLKMQTAFLEAEREHITARHKLGKVNKQLEIDDLEKDLTIAELKKKIRDLEKDVGTTQEGEEEELLNEISTKLKKQQLNELFERQQIAWRLKKKFMRTQDLRMAMEELVNMIKSDPMRDAAEIERDLNNLKDLFETMKASL